MGPIWLAGLCGLTSSIVYDAAPFHVEFVRAPSLCTVKRDVHLLTGTIASEGGDVAVHMLNGTLPDYTLHFGPASKDPLHMTTLAADIECNGTSVALNGTANCNPSKCYTLSLFVKDKYDRHSSPNLELFTGPNPPPPPPSNPRCALSLNQSACEAAKPSPAGDACSWCVSDDGLHKLCFVDGHTPPQPGWTCAP